MDQFAKKHLDSEVKEVDLDFLISKRIPMIDVTVVMKQQRTRVFD